MIRSYEAVTNEIDDVEAAVAEIMEQLAPWKDSPGKYTVGIVSCFSEYVESGVLAALSDRLPFEILGTTTVASSARGVTGDTMLSLLVLSSDDVQFATAISDPVATEDAAPIYSCYEAALAKLPGKPSLILSFFPLLTNVSSDFYIERMSEVSGNVPNFGTLSVDHNTDYRDSMVLYNGESCRNHFAVLLLYGDVSPRFYVGNVSRERVFPEKGVVTGAAGIHLYSINDMPISDYFASVGLKKNKDGSITGINSFPLLVDFGDNTQLMARAIIGIAQDGSGVCGGTIPVGSIVSIGAFDPEEIVNTTGRTVSAALAENPHSTMLIYPCIGRYYSQGLDPTTEINRIVETLAGSGIHYLAAYTGGEICPVYAADGSTVNRIHNNSVIVCAF